MVLLFVLRIVLLFYRVCFILTAILIAIKKGPKGPKRSKILQERVFPGSIYIMISIPKKTETFASKVDFLESLLNDLSQLNSIEDKIKLLRNLPIVTEYLETNEELNLSLNDFLLEAQFAILSVIAIGEGPIVFRGYKKESNIDFLVRTLADMENFYDTMGGIIGYHLTVLKLIAGGNSPSLENETQFKKPEGLDLSNETQEVRDAIRYGIEFLPKMGEIYPIGGAGERLNLKDPKTGLPLPAAQLKFCGKTLIEGLIRDLQAREYLHCKLFGKKVVTPIVLMTSLEKDNDRLVKTILKNNRWFGRPMDSFKIFCQPLVPVVTIEGHWSMSEVLRPNLKPGGHGVIWKIAQDEGVFDWLAEHGRTKALVRQINNPIAGVDSGLLAFSGVGLRHDKAFGFASCFRLVRAAEGVVVLVEKKKEKEFHYTISNIEYTNFEQYGIQDISSEVGSPYSLYPANTNILFIDLEEIRKAVDTCPIPGMLINLKSTAPYIDLQGKKEMMKAGRLETTMQNISDYIYNSFDHRIGEDHFNKLRTYLTYNDRRKTISVTKKIYDAYKPLFETPDGCYYDILLNAYDLLKHHCGFDMPEVGNEAEYLKNGPGFIFLYHPALGPLYSIISQKLIGGKIAKGSELHLEIAEIYLKDFHLDGSLLVNADGLNGKCILENVTVKNLGINRHASNVYWKNVISRDEQMRICIQGSGEFVAQNITFTGSHLIDVPDGYRVTAYMHQGEISYRTEKIEHPTWHWKYAFDSKNKIILSK